MITGLWSTPVGERVRLRRPALPGRRLAGAPQAGAGRRRADHRRRRRAQAHAGAGRPLRRRVQHAVRRRSSGSSSSATGSSRRARRSDRDPASLRYAAAAVVCLGADEAEFARRAAAIGREPDELRAQRRRRHTGRGRGRCSNVARRRRRAALSAGARPRRPRSSRCHRRHCVRDTSAASRNAPTSGDHGSKARTAKSPMTDRAQGRPGTGTCGGPAVRDYLDALRANKPKRGRKRTPDSIKKRLAAIDDQLKTADALNELSSSRSDATSPAELDSMGTAVDVGRRGRLRQGRRQLQRAPGDLVHRRGARSACRPPVLKRAGISRGGLTGSARARRARRRPDRGGAAIARGRTPRRARAGIERHVGIGLEQRRKSVPVSHAASRCAARSGRRRHASSPAATSASRTGWLNTRPWLDQRFSRIRSATTCSP